jgi:hypothetical protein
MTYFFPKLSSLLLAPNTVLYIARTSLLVIYYDKPFFPGDSSSTSMQYGLDWESGISDSAQIQPSVRHAQTDTATGSSHSRVASRLGTISLPESLTVSSFRSSVTLGVTMPDVLFTNERTLMPASVKLEEYSLG